MSRPEFATSHTRHFIGLADGSQMSTSFLGYAHPLRSGENGTLAGAWQQFALNSSAYQEQSVYLSYGRPVAPIIQGETDVGQSLIRGGNALAAAFALSRYNLADSGVLARAERS